LNYEVKLSDKFELILYVFYSKDWYEGRLTKEQLDKLDKPKPTKAAETSTTTPGGSGGGKRSRRPQQQKTQAQPEEE
jgi:hypothetical protein